MKKFIVYTTVYKDYVIEVFAENEEEAMNIVAQQSVNEHEQIAELSSKVLHVDSALEG